MKMTCQNCAADIPLPMGIINGSNIRCARCNQFNQYDASRRLTVPEILRTAAETFEQRSKIYGSNYKTVGSVMTALLPDGVVLETPAQWNRFLLFGHIINKVTRYAQTLNDDGHKDSAHDLAVYAAMLEELTEDKS